MLGIRKPGEQSKGTGRVILLRFGSAGIRAAGAISLRATSHSNSPAKQITSQFANELRRTDAYELMRERAGC